MYLGIDIGTSYTKIAGLFEGQWVDSNPEGILIPSLAAYLPSSEQLFYGNLALRLDEPGIDKVFFFKLALKRYVDFRLGPYNLQEVVEGFLSFLYSQYIKPSFPPLKYLALSVPNYFGLKSRQILLDAARKVFALNDVYLIPEPLAALIAFNTLNELQPLGGTILSIDIGGGTTDFSFLDVASDRQEIILESQFQIGYDAFSGSELDHGIIRNIFIPLYQMQTGQSIPEKYITGKSLLARDRQLFNSWLLEAEKLKLEISRNGSAACFLSNFYAGRSISSYIDRDFLLECLEPIYRKFRVYCQSFLRDRASLLGLVVDGQWHIDCILLQGGGSLASGVRQIISECFPAIPVIISDSPDLVARGLCCWNAQHMDRYTSLKTIYPFDFYRTIYDGFDNKTRLEKIPFDTANLELDILGRYKIMTFSPTNEDLKCENGLSLRIYEVAQGEAISTQERFLGMEAVLDLTGTEKEIPANIDIYLNMSRCRLEIDTQSAGPSWPETGPLFRDLFSRQLESLKWIENYKYINPDLLEDFAIHLEKQPAHAHIPYDDHAQTVFYKLLCLLQILDSK